MGSQNLMASVAQSRSAVVSIEAEYIARILEDSRRWLLGLELSAVRRLAMYRGRPRPRTAAEGLGIFAIVETAKKTPAQAKLGQGTLESRGDV